jgi:hypothetical protein
MRKPMVSHSCINHQTVNHGAQVSLNNMNWELTWKLTQPSASWGFTWKFTAKEELNWSLMLPVVYQSERYEDTQEEAYWEKHEKSISRRICISVTPVKTDLGQNESKCNDCTEEEQLSIPMTKHIEWGLGQDEPTYHDYTEEEQRTCDLCHE